MRARKVRVSSTLETSLRASAAESSATVASITPPPRLLENLGNKVQAASDRRRDRLQRITRIVRTDRVGTQPLARSLGTGLAALERVRHRLDPLCVDRAHLLEQSEHPVESLGHLAHLAVA